GGEVCGDGLDGDCDGLVDEDCACSDGAREWCYPGEPSQAGLGACHWGMTVCMHGAWGPCTGAGAPEPNRCDGMDHTCRGHVDDGCVCHAGQTRGCYDGPSGTEGVGTCHGGTQTCDTSGAMPAWGACTGAALPAAHDACFDHVDDDCNGTVDDGCP